MLLAALDHASRGGAHGPRFIFPLLLLLLIGFTASRVIRRKRGGGGHHHRHGSALATLQDRFARGEIDRDEYDHRLAVLNGDDVIPPAPARPAAAASVSQPAPPVPTPPTTATTPVTDPVADDTIADDVESEE